MLIEVICLSFRGLTYNINCDQLVAAKQLTEVINALLFINMGPKVRLTFPGLNCLPIDCNSLQSSTAKQTESKINSAVQKAKAASPVIVLLDNFEVNFVLFVILSRFPRGNSD